LFCFISLSYVGFIPAFARSALFSRHIGHRAGPFSMQTQLPHFLCFYLFSVPSFRQRKMPCACTCPLSSARRRPNPFFSFCFFLFGSTHLRSLSLSHHPVRSPSPTDVASTPIAFLGGPGPPLGPIVPVVFPALRSGDSLGPIPRENSFHGIRD
jgi:hypothetical protein